MRERLLAALLGLTLLTVLLYGIPRAIARADVIRDEAQADVLRAARVVAEDVAVRRTVGLPLPSRPPAYVDRDDRITFTVDGQALVLGADRAPARDDVRAEAPVRGGGSVEVRRPERVVHREIVAALRPIVLAGLASLAVAVVAAVLLAARLARPFTALAAQATELGRGQPVELPAQRVREAESIAAALRASSIRVASMLQRERDFARNASHQLRTPLTAMRLRLDDLATWPQTPPDVREELADVLTEVDRLSDTVTALLAFARQEDMGAWQEVDADVVVASAAQRWRGLAGGRGREVVATGGSGAHAALPRVAVDQVLDVLVDNALKHGAGTIALAAERADGTIRFTVRDEGEAPPAEQLFARRAREAARPDGEGMGLALCADLAGALGGRLLLTARRPTTFALVLPVGVA